MEKLTALVASGALLLGASTAMAGSITAVSWGGAYTKSQVEAYHKPWTAKTGNTVVSEDYSGGLAEVKAQVSAGNVTWDIVDLEMSDAVRGCDEGLFESIDPGILPAGADGTPAAKDFIDGTITECAIGSIVWSTIFAYDTSVMANGPKTIKDFFDLKNFPGKRGLRKTPKANMEMALAADGVATADIYEVLGTDAGVKRAFAKLDSIKDSVVWWEAGAQPPQLLADGEVIFTTAWNGRIFAAVASEEQSFEMVWDGQIYDLDLWVMPKGSKNKEAALDFLVFASATEQLAAQASYIPYGPARASSVAKIGTYFENDNIKMANHMPTAAANFKNALQNDFEFWADNADQLNERFNAWLAK